MAAAVYASRRAEGEGKDHLGAARGSAETEAALEPSGRMTFLQGPPTQDPGCRAWTLEKGQGQRGGAQVEVQAAGDQAC